MIVGNTLIVFLSLLSLYLLPQLLNLPMRYRQTLLLIPSLLCCTSVSAYVWPNPYDFLEDAYTVSSGFADGGIVDGVNPCSLSPIGGRLPGRQAASEWLRL